MLPADAQTRRRLGIYLATSALMASIAARGLTVPLYAHALGASRFEVGALFSVSTFAAALLSLPSGLLVDRFGPRTLLITSLALTVVSQLATAATPTVAPLFLWQLVGGLAAGMQQSALFSAITESSSGSRLGRAFGWLTFSMQTGFFLGPAVAGLLLRWLDVRTDIAVTTAIVLLAIPGAILASGTRQHHGRGLSLREPLSALVRQAAFLPLTVGLVAMAIGWGTLGAFLPVFGKEALGLPSSQVGYLLALQAIVNGTSRPFAGRLVDRARRRWPLLFAGVVAWSVTGVILGHLTGFAAPAVVLSLSTPFLATAYVTIGTAFADLSAGSTRGVAMGMFGTLNFGGLAAGPLVFGPLVQNYGYTAGFTACAVVSLVLGLVMVAMYIEPGRRRAASPIPPLTPGT
jgi:MFS family permease